LVQCEAPLLSQQVLGQAGSREGGGHRRRARQCSPYSVQPADEARPISGREGRGALTCVDREAVG
jgi:hypothetical protein